MKAEETKELTDKEVIELFKDYLPPSRIVCVTTPYIKPSIIKLDAVGSKEKAKKVLNEVGALVVSLGDTVRKEYAITEGSRVFLQNLTPIYGVSVKGYDMLAFDMGAIALINTKVYDRRK